MSKRKAKVVGVDQPSEDGYSSTSLPCSNQKGETLVIATEDRSFDVSAVPLTTAPHVPVEITRKLLENAIDEADAYIRGQGRTDDNEESVMKRIETYNNQTLPIIQHHEKLGLVEEVPSNKSAEEVYTGVVAAFKSAGF
ncbi:unnamed protein product [Nippostrongylus brasiliensis]|uniref:UMP-CMP kinase (inferred by orthology to a human protein) n=1 Tax=Nippostrongylus brasiliensis TaxID=27835 RepID=A0A0N4Y5D7_NIPBR|nr:unnamed protein product [Nippostrongylus brasiliensis]